MVLNQLHCKLLCLPAICLDTSLMLQGLKREKELLKPAQIFQCSYQSTDVVSKDVAVPARSRKTWTVV